jgi:hypothetical protein
LCGYYTALTANYKGKSPICQELFQQIEITISITGVAVVLANRLGSRMQHAGLLLSTGTATIVDLSHYFPKSLNT